MFQEHEEFSDMEWAAAEALMMMAYKPFDRDHSSTSAVISPKKLTCQQPTKLDIITSTPLKKRALRYTEPTHCVEQHKDPKSDIVFIFTYQPCDTRRISSPVSWNKSFEWPTGVEPIASDQTAEEQTSEESLLLSSGASNSENSIYDDSNYDDSNYDGSDYDDSMDEIASFDSFDENTMKADNVCRSRRSEAEYEL